MEKIKYKLLLIPSSEDETFYENLETYEEALALSETRQHDTSNIYTFDSLEERNAFIEGVEAMVGYRGEGLLFTTEEKIELGTNTMLSSIYGELKNINPADMTTAEKNIWNIFETCVKPIR